MSNIEASPRAVFEGRADLFTIVEDDDRITVCLEEEPKVRFIGNIGRPVFDPIVHVRNHRSLRRLEAAVLSRLAEAQAPRG